MNVKKFTLGFLEVELAEDKIILKSGDNKIVIYDHLAIETIIDGIKNIYFGCSKVTLSEDTINVTVKKD